jgi:hypothetical protein
MKKIKIILGTLVGLAILGNLMGLDGSDSSIEEVKNSPFIQCKGRTNEEVMNNYFSNPNWSSTYDGLTKLIKFEGVMKENFLPVWEKVEGGKVDDNKIILFFKFNETYPEEKWYIGDLHKNINGNNYSLRELGGVVWTFKQSQILDKELCKYENYISN